MAEATLKKFNAELIDIKYINPLFSSCKVKVLYTGDNRNNTSFSKETVDQAIPSLYNIPIIGEFMEKKEDFGGHGGKIEITDDEISFVQTTKPYGVVPESADVYWETVVEEGEEREYLIVDGCYLWTGRYEEAESVVLEGKGQSMEIEVTKGDFNNDNVFDIEEFTFSALCILGDEVEPCFEGANITSSYSLDKDEFKQQFNQMIKELKFSLDKNKEEGGDEIMGDKFTKKYELSHDDVRSKLYQKLDPTLNEDRFSWIVDVYETYFIVEIESFSEEGYNWKFYKFNFTKTENDEVEIDFDSQAEVVEDRQWVETSQFEKMKADFEQEKENAVNEAIGQTKASFADTEQELENLKTEIEDLRQFKQEKVAEERKESEAELFGKFSKVLTDEDVSELKEKSSDYSLEELETQLYILVGKKQSNFSVKRDKKEDVVKVKLDKEDKSDDKPYGDLFNTYK